MDKADNIVINPIKEDIINIKPKIKNTIKKDKSVSFTDDKIYINYEQDQYILKLHVTNNKNEKIPFKGHDLKK